MIDDKWKEEILAAGWAQYCEIMSRRDEILHAFIAKYGIEPDQAVLVVQPMDAQGNIRYWIEKMKTTEVK
jgi:hypothetical protein